MNRYVGRCHMCNKVKPITNVIDTLCEDCNLEAYNMIKKQLEKEKAKK